MYASFYQLPIRKDNVHTITLLCLPFPPSHHYVCHMCYLPCVMIMVGSLEIDRHMGKSLVWHLHGWLFLGRHDWTSDHLQESVNAGSATWLHASLSWWDTNFWGLLVGASPRSPPSTGQNSWKLQLGCWADWRAAFPPALVTALLSLWGEAWQNLVPLGAW